MTKEQQSVAADEIITQLTELSAMHRNGDLTTDEYNAAKRQVLGKRRSSYQITAV